MSDLPLVTSPGFVSAITGFPLLADPYTNIQPFTYRDGLTYLEVQECLRDWIQNTLSPSIDANMTTLQGAWDTEVAAIITAVNTAIDASNADMSGLVTQVNALVASLNSAINAAAASATAAAGSATAASGSATAAASSATAAAVALSTARELYGNLFINVIDYGADPTGATSSATAFTNAINAALTANSYAAAGGTDYRTVSVYIPAGTYLDDSTGRSINQTITDTLTQNQSEFTIKGAGNGQTVINATGANWITVIQGPIRVEGIRFIGTGSNTIITIGTTGTNASGQCVFSSLGFHTVGIGVNLIHAWDSAFYDCIFRNIGANGAGVNVPVHPTDNINNIHFFRCHWEKIASGGAGVRTVGAQATAAQQHGKFGFHGCHFETTNFGALAVDMTWTNDVSFVACQILQSGQDGGTVAAAPSVLRFVYCVGVSIISSQIARNGTGAWGSNLISLGGKSRGISLSGCTITTATGAASNGKDALWTSDPTTAYINGGFTLSLKDTIIDDWASAEVANELVTMTSTANRAKRWLERYNNGTDVLTFEWGGGVGDYATSMSVRASLGSDGVFNPAGGLTGMQQLCPAIGTQMNYAFSANNNANRRGLYFVTANDPSATSWAIVFSAGAGQIATVAAGANFAIGATDPGTAAKYNLFLSGNNLAVINRTASDRTVSILPIGF